MADLEGHIEGTIVKDGDSAGEGADDIKRAFGQLEERVTNIIADVGNHGEKLTNFEGDIGWLKDRANQIGDALATIPEPEFRQKIEARLEELAAQIAAIPQTLTQSLTEPPEREKRVRKNGARHGIFSRLF